MKDQPKFNMPIVPDRYLRCDHCYHRVVRSDCQKIYDKNSEDKCCKCGARKRV